jgi:hypothetical protein
MRGKKFLYLANIMHLFVEGTEASHAILQNSV